RISRDATAAGGNLACRLHGGGHPGHTPSSLQPLSTISLFLRFHSISSLPEGPGRGSLAARAVEASQRW
ncbi:unnamed protein product, partial [Urochloa humidicola]